MAAKAVPERIRWAVETLAPGPEERLLEIGCGPGVAVSAVCERLVGGRIVAIDRSATAIGRATRRNAEQVAAGKAVLHTLALEELQPADVLGGGERFDKVFAMNVNLFWVRSPARELELIGRLLGSGGALYLFYGYGEPSAAPAVPAVLTDHLTDAGYTVELRSGASLAAVVATPPRGRGTGAAVG
jgi:SAM-dependent methyltransferase